MATQNEQNGAIEVAMNLATDALALVNRINNLTAFYDLIGGANAIDEARFNDPRFEHMTKTEFTTAIVALSVLRDSMTTERIGQLLATRTAPLV